MKWLLFVALIAYGKLYSQVSYNSTSTINCNNSHSTAFFNVNTGTGPYTFSVQAPSCGTNTVYSNIVMTIPIPLSCTGVYTITIKDSFSNVLGPFTHTVSQASSINYPIVTAEKIDTICLGTDFLIGVTDSSKFSLSNISSNFLGTATVIGNYTAVLASPSITTTYSYSALFTNGTKTCTAFDNRTVVVVTSLFGTINCISSLKRQTYLGDIKFGPNPADHIVKLDYDFNMIELKRIGITDALGQIVYLFNKPEPRQEINISFLESGFYYMIVESREGQRIFKFIKE